MNRGVWRGNWVTKDPRSYQKFGSDCTEKKLVFQSERTETLNSSTIKYDEKMMWDLNCAQPEHFTMSGNSCVMQEKKDVKNMHFPKGSHAFPREFSFPKTTVNLYPSGCNIKSDIDNVVELMPVNPGKIFGQCRFQTTGNDMHVQEKYNYAEPKVQTKTWENPHSQNMHEPLPQAQEPANVRNKRALSDSPLTVEPSSPIENLSNLVAKIHPDHGNIMTGKKNPKIKGK